MMEKQIPPKSYCECEVPRFRWSWFTFTAGAFVGLLLGSFIFLSGSARASPISTKEASEMQKRVTATAVHDFCLKRELVNEIYRPSFALIIARDEHLADENMKGTPEDIGASLCLIELEDLRQYLNNAVAALGEKLGDLVPVASANVIWDKKLDDDRRLLVPFAKKYFEQLADDFSTAFPGRKFKVTSLLRTVFDQKNIALKKMSPLNCDPSWYCSAHVTGSAFDISLRGLTANELEYLRVRFRADTARLRVIAIKEGKSGCFHVQVIDPKFVSVAIGLLEYGPPDQKPPADDVERLPIPGKPGVKI